MSRTVSILVSVPLGAMLGCAAPQEPPLSTVNERCPMGQELVQASGGSAVWRGMDIGFCCAMCEPLFNDLSDAEKVAALRQVGVRVD